MRRTTFIVGAGASSELGLPVGSGLAKMISELFQFETEPIRGHIEGDAFALSTLRRLRTHFEPPLLLDRTINEAKKISRNMALAPSIDNFLHTHQGNDVLLTVGKIGIAHEILKAERNSSLYLDETNVYNRLDFSQMSENWLLVLFKILAEGTSSSDFFARLSQINFVCFNYDRVIERFFLLACSSYFDLSEDDTYAELTESLRITHPYGVVGELKPRIIGSGFGADLDPEGLIQASKGIRTFTEGVENPSLESKINDFVSESEIICFLGFAFHPINLRLFKPELRISHSRILATTRGLSEASIRAIMKDVSHHFRESTRSFNGHPMDCKDLIRDFSTYFSGR